MRNPYAKLFLSILIFALVVSGGQFITTPILPALAQGALTAEISAPEVSAFPVITTLLDVRDGQGKFVSGVSASGVVALEDGQSTPVDTVSELNPGAQIVVAVAPSPALAVRDNSGVSRYENIQQALSDWAVTLPEDNQDDLSLVSTAGSIATHQAVNEWLRNFTGFQPDLRRGVAGAEALNLALDVALSQPPQNGGKSAILFISSYLPKNRLEELDTIAEQARQAGIKIYIWHVDSDTYSLTPGALAMRALAEGTGGEYFLYTGREAVPDLETYADDLRHIYQVKYSSQVKQTGSHTLSLQLDVQGQQAISNEQTFDVTVEPPSAVLISPPLQILRETSPEDKYNMDSLSPVEQPLELLIEFPDDHPRQIVRTSLLVNGALVTENTSEPFDAFTLDLSPYTESTQLSLSIEIEDALGLKRSSLSVPVTVTVVQPPGGLRGFLERNRTTLVISGVVLAGVVLLVVVLAAGITRLPSRAARRKVRKAASDPVTQPVVIGVDRPREQSPSFSTWLKRKSGSAPAYLARLMSTGQPAPGAPIPLEAREMTFGTDPVQSTHVLDDPSISPLHTRIRQDEHGHFTIFDQGSIAGTWVNFEPVGRDGRRLEHGDTIHVGTLQFRFALRKAPHTPLPRVLKDDEK